MKREDIVEILKEYIAGNILHDARITLDEQTPLLEWGILNSLEMVRLITFINEQFQIQLSIRNLVADHFANLASLTDFVVKSQEEVQGRKQLQENFHA